MKDTYASVRLAQKPQNSFACYKCGRVILIADYLEAINIQLNCNRCGFKKHVAEIKIEKLSTAENNKSKFKIESINEISNT